MKRKCKACEKDIDFNENNLDEVIRFKKAYYHYNCFVDTCKKKSKNSKASPIWSEALESIDKIQQETKDFFKKNNDSPKDQLYRFLLENYGVMSIPTYVFKRLEDVYSGKRKGLACEIPPEDLLDMWRQKMGYLNKLRAKNKTLNKNMTTAQQINYDLSVLVNKYDDYLKWKERNKVLEQEANEVHRNILNTVNLDKLSKITQTQNQTDDDDIDSLLEELFD